MPTTYAHLRFGKEVLPLLPKDLQAEIKQYLPLFLTGQHGPDILFYYRPYHKNALSAYGSELHNETGCQVFQRFRRYLKMQPGDSTALKVYILGFLCHYCLDKYCHPYVYKVQDTGFSHAEIEAEFDRMLLIKDGFDPLSHRLSSHICTDDEDVAVISKCFPQFSQAQIKETLVTMRAFLYVIVAPGNFKRGLVKGIFLISGNYATRSKLIINKQPNPKLAASNEELYHRYKMAVANAVDMLTDFNRQLSKPNMTFNSDYAPTFERE